MLDLAACKALKAMGYPQDGYLRLGGEPFLSCTTVGWTEYYACPDSIDALDWLAAQFVGTWQKDTGYWFSAPPAVPPACRHPVRPHRGRGAGAGVRLLDLYCGAGGSAVGYHRAGFDEIVGVDLHPQPRYPFEFVQADALTYPLDGFDAIHASPPCQAFTALRSMPNARAHPDLVAVTRERLLQAGVPWVIENVPGAPLTHAVMLCGTMFRLGCEGAELRRHRLFETSFPVMSPSTCVHGWSGQNGATIGVYGHAGGSSRAQRYARRKNGQHFPTRARAEAMGIDWMTGTELSQAIPPCYTEFIGRCLLQWVS